jgi:hypothetical protein
VASSTEGISPFILGTCYTKATIYLTCMAAVYVAKISYTSKSKLGTEKFSEIIGMLAFMMF